MEPRKSASGILSTGGFVLTIVQSTHPEWFGNHPWVLPASIGLFFISFAYFLIQFKWIQGILGVQPIENDKAGNKTVVEAGNGIAAGRDVIGGSNFNSRGDAYFGDSAIVALAKATSVPSPPKPSPLPTLKCCATWVSAVYENHPGEWVRAEPHPRLPQIAVANFENPRAPKDSVGFPLKYIEANLKLHGSTGVAAINTAYWMNTDCNRIDIPPGHHRSVVLGHFSGDGIFVSYENEHSYSINGSFPSPRHLADPINVSADRSIRIEVALLEATNHHRTVTAVVIEIDMTTKAIQVIEP